MKIAKTAFGILAVGMLLTACNSVDFKKTKSGVPYKIFPSKSGEKIVEGNFAKFNFVIKVKDSVINSSYGKMPAYQPIGPNTSSTYDIGNVINELLSKSKAGDSLYMVFSADSLIAHNPMITQQLPLKKGDELIFTIKVLEVFRNEEAVRADYDKARVLASAGMEKEQLQKFKTDTMVARHMTEDNKLIEDYLAANHIQAQKTEWGAYVQVINPGQGPKPASGQYANVKYKVMNLKGETFEQGVYPLQLGTGGSIKGFEEGVKQLAKGGSGRVFVPSMLGYGPQGSGKIGPNQVLMFDLDVLEISDKPIAQAPPTNIDTTQGKK
jgi:FKBP-type peptidyl-prolyl cis-trans isomerase FkpA